MLHILLYVLTGLLAGVALMRWWQTRLDARRAAQSATHSDPARTLADAVLTVCLLTMRKDDVAGADEAPRNDGLRLPAPKDIVSFMSEGGAHTAAVRRYIEQQFPSIQDVGAFVTEIEAILEAFVNRSKMESDDDEQVAVEKAETATKPEEEAEKTAGVGHETGSENETEEAVAKQEI